MKKAIRLIINLLSGAVLTAASLVGLFILIVLLVIFYFFYRLIWLITPKGTFLRTEKKFKRTKAKLLNREFRQRKQYSLTIDEQNIHDLVIQINQELQLRKVHLDQQVLNETRYLLGRCQANLDFTQALHIHDIIANTHVASLNSTLNHLLNET